MYYFISFASEDKRTKEKIRNILYKNDIKYWTDDSEIVISENIEKKINEAINNTTSGIIIVSKSFFKTNDAYSWCKHELSRMLERSFKDNYNIVPIFLEPIDSISEKINDDDKELLNRLSGFHGLNLFEFEGDLGFDHLEEFVVSREHELNSIFEDENGYFCYWGTEYGQLGMKDKLCNYLFIDTVHADKGRQYVIIGKFELVSIAKSDKKYNEQYRKLAIKNLKKYITENTQEFKIIFSNKLVYRKDFSIVDQNENISVRLTSRVIGIYPFGMNIDVNYMGILMNIEDN